MLMLSNLCIPRLQREQYIEHMSISWKDVSQRKRQRKEQQKQTARCASDMTIQSIS